MRQRKKQFKMFKNTRTHTLLVRSYLCEENLDRRQPSPVNMNDESTIKESSVGAPGGATRSYAHLP